MGAIYFIFPAPSFILPRYTGGGAKQARFFSITRLHLGARKGFTAVEMVAVLALTALIAGMTTLSLSSPSRSSQMDEVLDRLSYCDALARQTAASNRTALRLVLDPQAGEVRQTVVKKSRDDLQTPHVVYRLPHSWRIDRLVAAPEGDNDGAMEIGINATGRSASYAVRLTGPVSSRWLVIFGMTGQSKQVRDEQQAMDMLGPIGSPGDDAG